MFWSRKTITCYSSCVGCAWLFTACSRSGLHLISPPTSRKHRVTLQRYK